MGKELDLSKYVNEFSLSNKLGRVAWSLIYTLFFRFSPKPLNSLRILTLRAFGASIGRQCQVYASARIWAPWNLTMGDYSTIGPEVECYSMDKIVIGNQVTVSQKSYLCTGSHDISSFNMKLFHRPIEIKDMAWICAQAFIHPGVTIGKGAVVSACGVVKKDVADMDIVMGNPATPVGKRTIE